MQKPLHIYTFCSGGEVVRAAQDGNTAFRTNRKLSIFKTRWTQIHLTGQIYTNVMDTSLSRTSADSSYGKRRCSRKRMLRHRRRYIGRQNRRVRNQAEYRTTGHLNSLHSRSWASACMYPICALTGSGDYNQTKCTYGWTSKERGDVGSNSSADEEERYEAIDSCELERCQPRVYGWPVV